MGEGGVTRAERRRWTKKEAREGSCREVPRSTAKDAADRNITALLLGRATSEATGCEGAAFVGGGTYAESSRLGVKVAATS
mgnify:CR=1 FL=1